MTWKIQGSRVYGNGISINCTNKVTAKELHNKLTTYENTIHELEKQIKLEKHFQTIIMDLKILKEDIEILKEKLQ